MARTVIGMSPWPVMKTIGIRYLPRSVELALEIEPAQPGQPHVENEARGGVLGYAGRLRKSGAEANVSTRSPTDTNQVCSTASRTDASSSTTNTIASPLGLVTPKPLPPAERDGKRELEPRLARSRRSASPTERRPP